MGQGESVRCVWGGEEEECQIWLIHVKHVNLAFPRLINFKSGRMRVVFGLLTLYFFFLHVVQNLYPNPNPIPYPLTLTLTLTLNP